MRSCKAPRRSTTHTSTSNKILNGNNEEYLLQHKINADMDDTTDTKVGPPRSDRQDLRKNRDDSHHHHKHHEKRRSHEPNQVRRRTLSNLSTRGSLRAVHHSKHPSHVNVKKSAMSHTVAAQVSDDIEGNYHGAERLRTEDVGMKSRNSKPIPRHPLSKPPIGAVVSSPDFFNDNSMSDLAVARSPPKKFDSATGTENRHLLRDQQYGQIRYDSMKNEPSDEYKSNSSQGNSFISVEDEKSSIGGTKSSDREKRWIEDLYAFLIYNKEEPEFTTIQQYFWSSIIGIIMGGLTALWSWILGLCVNIVWIKVPEFLLELGVFTDVDGPRPLPHYMWICPALFGGVLSYISVIEDTPTQGTWIDSIHRIGILDGSKFLPLLLLSTAGMASGLSLGPEGPLVLLAGMIGSSFAVYCRQSILSARVMNLTAASASIAGFFGFPMAGALFVLELPHRMGLEYFEAVSPAVLASIVSVVVNQMVTPDDEVSGTFTYPPRTSALHKKVFRIAFIYGCVGLIVGVGYAKGCLFLKKFVHDLFHTHHDDNIEHDKLVDTHVGESVPPMFVDNPKQTTHTPKIKKEKPGWFLSRLNKITQLTTISSEPKRAAVAGMVAGAIVGIICMFVPHSLFWGEAQLQTLIDRGRTPLPILGDGQAPTALVAYGYCLINPEDGDSAGFSTACAAIISVTKIFTIGLSLGTGIIGGHFWGPLYVGCAASHLFVDLWTLFREQTGFETDIVSQPGVVMLCIMGSSHVVTFRAHMAIMLILTLSIRSSPEINNYNTDDYLAIFPLLVISCFISLVVTKEGPLFYKDQGCRGDINVVPEVLCEPNKGGSVNSMDSAYYLSEDDDLIDDYDDYDDDDDDDDDDDGDDDDGDDDDDDDDDDGGISKNEILYQKPEEPPEEYWHETAIHCNSLGEIDSQLDSSRHSTRHRRIRSSFGRIENFSDNLLQQGRANRSRSNTAGSGGGSRSNTPLSRQNSFGSMRSRANSIRSIRSRVNSIGSMRSRPDTPTND